jgi:hypothetical protein
MQQTDRTTKVLLLLIAIALWGLLLKSIFTPTPSEAQSQTTQTTTPTTTRTTTRTTTQLVNPLHVVIDGVTAKDVRGNRSTLLLQDVKLSIATAKEP